MALRFKHLSTFSICSYKIVVALWTALMSVMLVYGYQCRTRIQVAVGIWVITGWVIRQIEFMSLAREIQIIFTPLALELCGVNWQSLIHLYYI